MRTAPVAPYLLAPQEAVTTQGWVTAQDQPVEDRLEHWDPFTQVELFQTVDVDIDAIRSACRLDEGSSFAIAVSWYSRRTRLTEAGPAVELGSTAGAARASLRVEIPGDRSGGDVELRTRLVLRHPGHEPSAISPRRVGATLWAEEVVLALEGSAARFPVTPVDFAGAPRLPDRGGWMLEWDPRDLSASVLGGMRLLVNSGDEELMGALRTGTGDGRAAVLRAFLRLEVARTIVRTVLEDEDFVDSPEQYEDGTVGRMAFELIAMAWPAVPVRALASRLRDDPGRLEAELQSHLGVLA